VVMLVIYLSSSVGTLTMFMKVVPSRINYGNECDFWHRLNVRHLYLSTFSLVRNG
jgi:hypothetical protein